MRSSSGSLDLDYLAATHVDGVVCEGLGEMGLMGGDDQGAASGDTVDGCDGPGAEVGEELDHVVGAGYVEVGERLVEEEEFGVGLEDSCERGSLTHALGVLAEGAGEGRIEADGAEGHLGGAHAGAAFFAVESGEVVEIFHGGELVVEHGGVAHVGHAAALQVGPFAEDGGGAACGGNEARDDAEEGRFTSSVFAEDDGGGSGVEGCGDVAQGGEGAVELGDGVDAGGCCSCCFGASYGCGWHRVYLLCLFMRVYG